jgi:hypothetical protein
MKRIVLTGAFTAMAIVAVGATAAQAAPFYPDISATLSSLQYNAATDTLTVQSSSLFYSNPPTHVNVPVSSGSFLLTAIIDGTGALSSASLSISGQVGGTLNIPNPAGVILQSNSPTAFSSNVFGTLEFDFSPVASAPGLGFGPLVHVNIPFTGLASFTTDYNLADVTDPQNVTADTYSVPEPASFGLLALGLAAAAARRRHRL